MELTYLLKRLDFAPSGEFAYPHATVLVQPAHCPSPLVPTIRLQIRITSAAAAGGLAAIAAAAQAEARRLLPPPTAELHLQALVDEEQQIQAQQREQDAVALLAAMHDARPQSDG